MKTEPVEVEVRAWHFTTSWWVVLLRGIAATLLGLLLLARPRLTLIVIVQVLAAYWLIDGILNVINAVRGRKVYKDWRWRIFGGILGIIAGALIFTHPFASAFLTQFLLLYLVAFAAILGGVTAITAGIRWRKEIDYEWSMIVAGAISIIFGVLLLITPLLSSVALIWIASVVAIAGGIALILYSFRLRRLRQSTRWQEKPLVV